MRVEGPLLFIVSRRREGSGDAVTLCDVPAVRRPFQFTGRYIQQTDQ